MKTLKAFIISALVFILSSCATSVKFPISSVIPAADIVASVSKDNNGNTKITIKAKNLAAVERLIPPKSAYVVWIETERDGVKNIGKLLNKNAQATGLETLTPFKFSEVFITAEDFADAAFPAGVEISRTRLK
jgi:hypothetical protein